ncbi:hypothetical protein HC891_00535 [Candidatus Gracilibacteria bacterium]|nr:hypothetical protein [Candidatus Gracilibacteria bacterium]
MTSPLPIIISVVIMALAVIVPFYYDLLHDQLFLGIAAVMLVTISTLLFGILGTLLVSGGMTYLILHEPQSRVYPSNSQPSWRQQSIAPAPKPVTATHFIVGCILLTLTVLTVIVVFVFGG